MNGSAPVGQWIVTGASALIVLGLSCVGVWVFPLALAIIPLIMGISGWTFRSAPRRLTAPVFVGVCAILAATTPNEAYFYVASIGCGALLSAFLARRPSEDDCYHLIPLLYVALLGGLFLVDGALRKDGAWQAFRGEFLRQAAAGQTMQESVASEMPLPDEEPARWREASRLLPYRATGVLAAAAGILFYAVTAGARRWLSPVRLMKNRFIYFRVKEIYLGFLAAGLAMQALWILKPWPWAGHLAYALLFFSGAALALETLSLAVFFGRKASWAGAGIAAGVVVATLLAAAPALSVPCAAVGLADVWLDFRKLDRILGGVHQ